MQHHTAEAASTSTVQNIDLDGQTEMLALTVTRNRRSKVARRSAASQDLKGCTVRYGNEQGAEEAVVRRARRRGDKDDNRDWEKEHEQSERVTGNTGRAARGSER